MIPNKNVNENSYILDNRSQYHQFSEDRVSMGNIFLKLDGFFEFGSSKLQEFLLFFSFREVV